MTGENDSTRGFKRRHVLGSIGTGALASITGCASAPSSQTETRTQSASSGTEPQTGGQSPTGTPTSKAPLVEEIAPNVLDGMDIPEGSTVYLSRAEPGMRFDSKVDLEEDLEIPNLSDGDNELYVAIIADLMPGYEFVHPVKFGWYAPSSDKLEFTEGQWRPILVGEEGLIAPDYSVELSIQGVTIRSPGLEARAGKARRSHSRIWADGASAVTGWRNSNDLNNVPDDAKQASHISVPDCMDSGALVIDGGDLDLDLNDDDDLDETGAETMAADADRFADALRKNGYTVRRISQYWNNSHPKIMPSPQSISNITKGDEKRITRRKKQLADLHDSTLMTILNKYRESFENCLTQEIYEGESLNFVRFAFVWRGHANDDEIGIKDPYGGGISLGTEFSEKDAYRGLAAEMKKFPECTKFFLFFDGCEVGGAIEHFKKLCDDHVHVEVVTATDSESNSPVGEKDGLDGLGETDAYLNGGDIGSDAAFDNLQSHDKFKGNNPKREDCSNNSIGTNCLNN